MSDQTLTNENGSCLEERSQLNIFASTFKITFICWAMKIKNDDLEDRCNQKPYTMQPNTSLTAREIRDDN